MRDATGRLLDDALEPKRGSNAADDGMSASPHVATTLPSIAISPRLLTGLPRAAFVAALNAEGVPARAGYGVPVYRYPAFEPDALAQSPLRGLQGVPRYDQLNLPVTERVCAYEQITIPHPSPADGVRRCQPDGGQRGQDTGAS